jgi:modification target Cys-rich repeat protein
MATSVTADGYNNILDEIVDNIVRRGGEASKDVIFNRSDKIDHTHANTELIAKQSLLNYDIKPVQDEDIPVKGSLLVERFYIAMGQIRDDFKYNHQCSDCLGVCVNCTGECVNICSRCYNGCHDDCFGGCYSGSNWSEGSSCWFCAGRCDTWCAGRCDNNCCFNCKWICSDTCENACAGSCGNDSCATGCKTICTNNCDLTCGVNCDSMARVGALIES